MPSGTSLKGKKFGRLTVLHETAVEDIYSCRCACGTEVELYRSQLIKRVVTHCGCQVTERRKIQVYGKYPLRYKHLRSYQTKSGRIRCRCTGEYLSYRQMLNRCSYKTLAVYEHYGARGIEVCPRWRAKGRQGFVNFLDDLGARPVGRTLDRINVQGHYEPDNCRWADQSTQVSNRRMYLFEEGQEPPVVPLDIAEAEEQLAFG